MVINVFERTARSRARRPSRPVLLTAWVLTALLTAAPLLPAQPRIVELDAIVAVVNDDVVVRTELEREIDLVLPQLQRQGSSPPPREELAGRVLEQLILKRLQRQRARELGIRADDATLTEALISIAQRNGLTLDELRQTLEAGGVDFESFREDTRAQIISSRLQNQEVVSKIQVTEQEIDRFLAREASRLVDREQVRLQHILLALPENPTPEQVSATETRATRLVARLRAGADFGEVAARESDGRNAMSGGDLGWFEMGAVPSLAADLAYSMAEGEISDPLRSASGWHIIKLREIKAAEAKPIRQTQVRHILIRTSELVSDNDARQRLTQLRTRIQGGDDFAMLARANSDDTGSALRGGDLGWLSPGDTVPEFEAVMLAQTPKTVSEPFKSPFGWHILEVLDQRAQGTADELLRIKAREALQRRKSEEAIELWLRELRDEAYVEIRLDEDDILSGR